jgi:hypothetical protein
MIVLVLIIVIAAIVGWSTSNSKGKHQWVRLLDVVFYGPMLIWIAYEMDKPNVWNGPFWVKYIVAIFGATTISYNLQNYISIARDTLSYFY